MNNKITGTDAYVYIAALASISGVSDNTALKYCKESFETLCKNKGLNRDDIIRSAAKELMMNVYNKDPFGSLR